MAHSCVSSSLRFNYSSLSFSTLKLALPPQPICAWKLRKSNPQESSVKAVYTPECYASYYSPRQGIWSIRDDLQVSYFPAYAQGGQGPPPMV